ncbi:MAG: hypothetical protein WEA24_06500 [Gemmatimonadota bacterium]
MRALTRLVVIAALAVPLIGMAACIEDPLVPDVQNLMMSPDSVEIAVGATATFKVQGRGRFGEIVSDMNVTWDLLGGTILEEVSSTTTGQEPSITVRALQVGTGFVRARVAGGAARSATVVVVPEG